jgi:hypothetical protein
MVLIFKEENFKCRGLGRYIHTGTLSTGTFGVWVLAGS